MIEDSHPLADPKPIAARPTLAPATLRAWRNPLLWTLVVLVASWVASWICMWVMGLAGITSPGVTSSEPYGIAPHVVMGIVTVVLVIVLALPKPIKTLGLDQFDRKAVMPSSLGSIAAMNAGTYLVWIMQSMARETSGPQQSSEWLNELHGDEAMLYGIGLFMLAAVHEELLFRGYLMRRWLACWSPARSIGLSGFVFALAHLSPAHALAVLPVGVWFGYVAWRTNSTLTSIIAHAATLMFWLASTLVIKAGVHEQWYSIANLVVTIFCAWFAWGWMKSPHAVPPAPPAMADANLGGTPASSDL